MNAHRREACTYDGLDRLTGIGHTLDDNARLKCDPRGRLTTIAHPAGDTLRLTYDAVGRIQSIEDNTSRIDYRYDAADRLIRERTTNAAGSHEVAYTWDSLDRLIQRTVNGGDPTHYRYDLAGRLIEIEYRGSLTTYLWDAADRLVARTLPNGIHQSYSWDAASRLTHIEYRDAEDQLIEAIAYEYDAKGQRTRKTGGPGSAPETPFEAEYDAADRMTQITLYPGTEDEATYNLEYDAEGNLTRKQNLDDSSDTTDYTWDVRNRLIAITSPNLNASFRYDALNRRIERTLNGQTLRAIYDGPQLIGEIAGGLIDPTYLTGLQIDEMIARHTHPGARTYLTDALGSVIAQTTDDQTPINWYAYSPYGEVDIIGNDEGNPVQYTGRENDGTGLYYYRARYYDPVLKRFISRDPIGLMAGVNFYMYVDGNPVLYIDPWGFRGEQRRGQMSRSPYAPGGAKSARQGGARLGVIGCIGPYCQTWVEGQPTDGSIGVGGLGGGILICEPLEQLNKSCPSDDDKLSPSWASPAPTRIGMLLGVQINSDGTKCILMGLMGGIPGPNVSIGIGGI